MKFNSLDGSTDRISFFGEYEVEKKAHGSIPINPWQKHTGRIGKGKLYYWGVNHAVKAVFTRFKCINLFFF